MDPPIGTLVVSKLMLGEFTVVFLETEYSVVEMGNAEYVVVFYTAG
jgi:hypothetical protein